MVAKNVKEGDYMDWKHYIDKYEVSEDGRVRNTKTGRILKPKKNKRGYIFYGISVNGKYKDIIAHRAVAELFIENPYDKPQVNHKDGNKENNYFLNLEWSTESENMIHAFENGLNDNSRFSVAVNQIDKYGNVVATYSSIAEASKAVNGYTSHITNCCKGRRNTHKGFSWRYAV